MSMTEAVIYFAVLPPILIYCWLEFSRWRNRKHDELWNNLKGDN